jgi:hypothetical protein
MSGRRDAGSSLSQEDAKRIEMSYKTLYELQRKNLAFLYALQEYENKRAGSGDGKTTTSRIAFIVTPLMVNHYNHMHHVYRASMYGKVPDLCDQTGGIMCTDLGALRQELASHTNTKNVNRSLTTTYRTATLPNVRFNFKQARDNVVETAVRMLDSIEIKQPDLTHSIRDDYIQNVRAIQESLTNALEKSRERSAELQAQLSEASRKLKLTEKMMASVPEGAEKLRKEVVRLKEQIIKQQGLVLEQRVEYDANTLRLRESESECNLLRELMKRINEQTKEGAEGLNALRAEMHKYTEVEMKKLRDDYQKIQNELIQHVKNSIDRKKKENEDTMKLCRSLMSRDASDADMNEKFIRLQRDYHSLENENADLKRQIAGVRNTVVSNRITPPLYTIDDSSNSSALSVVNVPLPSNEDDNDDDDNVQMDYGSIAYENVIENTNTNESDAVVGSIVEKYNELVKQFKSKEDYYTSMEARLKESHQLYNADLDTFYKFFTDPTNVDAALRLKEYFHANNINLKSEFSNLENYMVELQHRDDLITDQLQIDKLQNTITYSDEIMTNLVLAINSTYHEIAGILQLDRLPDEIVAADHVIDYFNRRFGENFRKRIILVTEKLKEYYTTVNDLQVKNSELITKLTDLENENLEIKEKLKSHDEEAAAAAAAAQALEKQQQQQQQQQDQQQIIDLNIPRSDKLLKSFDHDPLTFKEILQKVWAREETDGLHQLLETAYTALAFSRIQRYETNTAKTELKLYNLVEYTMLTDHILRTSKETVRAEFASEKLKEKDFFLDYFISQIGNVQIENYLNTLDIGKRNQLALILFKDFFIPIINKESYVMSIEGPFANFNIVYKM